MQDLDPLLRGLRGPRQCAEEVRAVNAEDVFHAKATGRTAKEGSTLWETCSTCANFSQFSTESKEHLSDSSCRLCRRTLMVKHFLTLEGQDYINPRASCGCHEGDDNKHWDGSTTGPGSATGDQTLILIS